MRGGYYGEERLEEVLRIERGKDGLWEQRAWYSHPDLHDELVLDVDGPFATMASAETLTLRVLVVGDRNAGKSTLLHSFMNAHDRDWLWLSSVLPVLSGGFSNIRYGPEGPFSQLLSPPRDELPYLDTDVARCTLVFTREDYGYFCEEFHLEKVYKQEHEYVALELYEIGGDHLDAMIFKKVPVSQMHAAALAKSLSLLTQLSSLAYFVNCAQLALSPRENLSQLVDRLHWLRQHLNSSCQLRLFASRLPSSQSEEIALLSRLSGECFNRRTTPSVARTDSFVASRTTSDKVQENDETRSAQLYEAIRRDDLGTTFTRGLWKLLEENYSDLHLTEVRPARHVTSSHAHRSSVHVPGLISVLVALCRSDAFINSQSTWLELFTCAAQAASTIHFSSQTEDAAFFAPAVSATHYAEWLEDSEQQHTCCGGSGVHQIPAHLALSRFAQSAKALAGKAFLHHCDPDGHAYPRVLLLVNDRKYCASDHATIDFSILNSPAFFAQAGEQRSIAQTLFVRAPLFPPLCNLLSRCLEHDLVEHEFPLALKPELKLVSEKLTEAVLTASTSPADDAAAWVHRVLWLAEDCVLVHRLQQSLPRLESDQLSDSPCVVTLLNQSSPPALPSSSPAAVTLTQEASSSSLPLQIEIRPLQSADM